MEVHEIETWLKEGVCDGEDEGDDGQVELAQVDPEQEVGGRAELVGRAGEKVELRHSHFKVSFTFFYLY
jgi:hypothetical protein